MMDLLRFILGSFLIVGLMTLAVCIALGKVEEKTSFGLMAIFAILSPVVRDFSTWVFGAHQDKNP
jgi:uncharacterized membrane protein